MTTIIIGAGASGLACAIRLKQNNADNEVVLLERLDTPGKKLLATGNGRCNLTNENAPNYENVVEFFNELGLITRSDDEGRIYPYSSQATTVLDILVDNARALGVKLVTGCEVEAISKDLVVKTSKGKIKADRLVIATGGKAQEALGSNGSGYSLLKSVGHTITPLTPALVQLTSSSKYPRQLKGHRVKCNMTILIDNEPIKSEYGEVLFADYGLSGIVSMNLSYIVSDNFSKREPKHCHAVLDLIPDMDEQELLTYINRYKSLKGILGGKLSDIIEKQADGNLAKMATLAKSWKLIITGTKGYAFAQITSGGAKLDEFDGYKSRLVDGLYACGEVMDKQFECGGYNLNHAWLSGIEVADSI